MILRKILFLFSLVIISIFSRAQTTKIIIKASEPSVWLYLNAKNGVLPLDELPNPFQYEIGVRKGDILSFKSKVDTVTRIIDDPSETIVLHVIRLYRKDTLVCNFTLFAKPEKASFSKKYIKKYDGTISVEIPKVYELMNIIFAITPTGRTNGNLIYKTSAYYKQVQEYFGSYDQESIVKKMDSILKENGYCHLKMEAYSLVFNKRNKIDRSGFYFTTSWKDKNYLLPYIDLLNEFSSKTDFSSFYKRNEAFYRQQISLYKDSLSVVGMKGWLDANFPDSYNSIKVIFSPLVNAEQSSNTIENNGFKEVHAHVNFSYKQKNEGLTIKSQLLIRSNIVFTEVNHAYLSPLSEKYDVAIAGAISDLTKFNQAGRPAQSYGSPASCFDEYMNWALISLYYHDVAERSELSKLLQLNERYMKRRGFIKFAEFNNFLVDLYHHKRPDQTIASLYPQIIEWFSKINSM